MECQMSERPTIKTIIAEAAGVSTTVVSAVVNGKANQTVFVGPEKKALVCKLIKQMNYVPRKSARNLRSQKTDVIGAIFNSLSSYFASLLEDLQHRAYRRGVEILSYLTGGDLDREEGYLRQMSNGRVDGVLTGPPLFRTCRRLFSVSDLAIVGYDDSHICRYTTPPLTSINTNCEALSQTMIDKIMQLIDEKSIETHTSIEPRLIVRGSSAPVHASVDPM